MHPCQSHGRVSAQQPRGVNFGKTWPTPVRKGGALHHERLDLNPTGDSRGNWSWELWIFFADYSKGFDLIDHSIHLRELMSFDISTVLINWIRAFLTGRSQAVKLENLCLIGSHPGEVSRKGRNWVWFCLLWWPTIFCVSDIWGLNSLMIPRH